MQYTTLAVWTTPGDASVRVHFGCDFAIHEPLAGPLPGEREEYPRLQRYEAMLYGSQRTDCPQSHRHALCASCPERLGTLVQVQPSPLQGWLRLPETRSGAGHAGDAISARPRLFADGPAARPVCSAAATAAPSAPIEPNAHRVIDTELRSEAEKSYLAVRARNHVP